jgi:serine/threonine protein kinase
MHILDESEVEKTVVERAPVLPPLEDDSPPSPPPPATHAVSRPVIGRTRIDAGLVVDTVGAGGMASVYKVWNERLEIFRAVKMLSSDTLHARFETEVKLSAKLRHPHIVEVYSVGEWNGIPYMEMEYMDGQNLQEALRERGRFPDAVCCATALCVASALDYAHTLKFTLGGEPYRGIIHRDLKPANILVSKRSEIKLTDFGIARPAQAGLHTVDGNIVGTLHYLSPEQMDGGEVDPRSDIYSFGAILYEMATGAKAFPQKSITELTKHRAANSFKPPSGHGAPVNPALSDIILKCLKADARERYQSAAELIGDLQKAYVSIAPGSAPQKTLYGFFSGEADDAGLPPTTSINAAEAMGAATEKPPTTKRPFPELPIKPPSGKAAVYALAALLSMSASYLSVRHVASLPKGGDGSTRADAALFFVGDSAAGRDDARGAGGEEPKNADAPDARWPAKSIGLPDAAKPGPIAAREAMDSGAAAADSGGNNATATATATAAESTDTFALYARAKTATPAPSAPAQPATESALIKSATDAMAKKEWDRAIRTLERNGAAFTEKRTERILLLLEAYVESRQLDKARLLIEGAVQIDDAQYFLTAGRYWLYRGDHAKALEALEASLTRSSLTRGRGAVFGDAIYYIALARSERHKAAPTDANRALAADAWKRVRAAHEPNPASSRFKRAEAEIAGLK